ncbi:unnamed protein product [Closterium sp. Naga37s-1]|nr:unnamed protein product [Closterium sp. Naga37s-1]
MKLVLGPEFPNAPPKGFFVTRIFHPNVAKNGEICVNTLKKDWKPCLGLRHVLIVVRCLLIEPYPESALNEDAGKLLLEDYEAYAKHARLFTSIHAPSSAAAAAGTTALAAGGAGGSAPLAPNRSIANAEVQREEGVGGGAGGSSGGLRSAGSKGENGARGGHEKKKVDARKKSLRRL